MVNTHQLAKNVSIKLALSFLFSLLAVFILFTTLTYTLGDVDLSYFGGMDEFDDSEEIRFNYDTSLEGYLSWLTDLIKGETKTIELQVPIKIFSIGESIKPVGLIFFKTIGFTFLCLSVGIILSLLIKIKTIFSSGYLSRFSKIVDNILSLLSGIHVIILAIILLGIYDNASQSIPMVLMAFIVIVGSNIYYDISSFQGVTLQRLKESDYILAAKAWGDSTFKHMRRTVGLMLLNQLNSSWSHVLTNVIIVEIIFQRGGLGFEFYKQIFSEENLFPDISVILAISVLAVLSIQFVSALREITHSLIRQLR